ncbi:MAG: acetate--CoA ligase family protein [Acidimicrobiia bacterium]|jgi:acetyltransferase
MTGFEPIDRVGSIEAYFRPSSVAVVGASSRTDSGGHVIFRNLVRLLDVPVHPVHPTAQEILGRKCYPSIDAVPGDVDLAVVFVPSQEIPGIVEQCVDAGVRAVCVEAGGFADAGEHGSRLQKRLADLAAESGIRIWGPNCAGFISTDPYISTAFVDAPESMARGSTSLVFQSGMAAAALLADITSRGLFPIDKACSIGNKVDVDEADLLAFLASRGTSTTVAVYLESIVDGGRLRNALDALVPNATVCALIGNRTPAGLRAAATHTGAIVEQSDMTTSFLEHAGVVEADDFTDLIDLAKAFTVCGPRRGGSRIAVLTFSGAAGVVAADLLDDAGLSLATLSDQTLQRLGELFPDWYQPANPVDVWSTVEQLGFAETTAKTAEAVLADESVDAVVFVPLAFGGYSSDDIRPFADVAQASDKPVVMWPIGEADVIAGWGPLLEEAGVPTCPSLRIAIEVLAGYDVRAESLRRREASVDSGTSDEGAQWPALPALSDDGLVLDEVQSKLILSRFGIPCVREAQVATRDEAVEAAETFDYPVVLKLVADGVAHKSDIGGVILDVVGKQDVGAAFDRLMANAAGAAHYGARVVVQPKVEDGVEMIVGAKRDGALGWFVVVGMGGVDVESLADVAMRPAPLTRADAESMVRDLRGFTLLDRVGGERESGVDAVVAALLSLSDMTLRAPDEVEGIEVNPLIVPASGSGALAVDALVALAGRGTAVSSDELEPVGGKGGVP